MDRTTLLLYLGFYRIPTPTVYVQQTASRQEGLFKYVLAKHLGVHGIAGKAAAEWGGSDEFV